MIGVFQGTVGSSEKQPLALTCDDSSSRKMSASECLPEQMGYLRQLTTAVLSVSFAMGVLGNGLVLWMTTFRMTRTVTTIWFFNLALADFLGLLFLPIAIHNVAFGQWPLDDVVCKLYMAFLALNLFASIYFLVLISVDRCLSVLYPVWARNHRTTRRAGWLALGVWLLAATACSPYLKFRATGTVNGCDYCYFKFNLQNEGTRNEEPWKGQMAVAIAHFLLGFLVPLVIIGTCAHLIQAKLRQVGLVHSSRPKRMLLVLVTAFFLFWFPFNMALLVQSGLLMLQNQSLWPKMMLVLWAAFSLGCLNSCLNPFLYVFIGRDFQEKFFQSLPSALARAFGDEGFISSCPRDEVPRGQWEPPSSSWKSPSIACKP
uniref:LOW QUALITY PROTEIN: probable G-protein coupled receptor 32 n=1 Tax=Ictidomys tridecemlineatus TaxID=43179 RepID=UPI00038C1870|nr:LOW QUALITY PROTEIN: probable G-protein coupled receptor 32 [Ictidomys tridecemlineatus]